MAQKIIEHKNIEEILHACTRLGEYVLSYPLDQFVIKTIDEAELLTGSKTGFFHFLEDDQKTISIQNWSSNTRMNICKDRINMEHQPLNEAGAWIEAIKKRSAVIHNDYAGLPERKGLPDGHVQTNRELAVPIIRGGKIKSIIGVGNKSEEYDAVDIYIVSMLGSLAWDMVNARRTEEALRKSEEKYRMIIETTNEGVWMLDDSSKTSYVNSRMAQMLGYAKGEMIGKSYFDFMDASARMEAEKKMDIHRRGIIETYDLRLSRKDGTYIWSIITSNPIFNEMGQYIGGLKMVTDITEKKRVEELRIINERLEYATRAKTEFLASMSHELRTPLHSILGFSQLLNEGVVGELNEKQKRYINNINEGGKFLLNLINDILDLSKVEAGKITLNIEKIRLHTTIDETLTLIKENALKHNIIIKKKIEPGLEFINADRQRFKQVLFNLLSNAVKFSKESGGILEISARNEGGMVQVSITDTGIGIKPENLDKLFHKFEQLDNGPSQKFGGTGLGLAITKQLVELHGGKIWAQSKYGEGTTFTFTLPLT